MKLVQLLAKELKEWHDNVKCITQDGNGYLYGWRMDGAEFRDHAWYSPYAKDLEMIGIDIECQEMSSDHKTSKINKLQWQAEREKMNKPKWIRHRGGWMPVGAATIVEVRLRCGDIQKHEACEFLWRHKDCDFAVNIMAYRVIEETKDQEIEEVKDTNIGTLTYKLEIDETEATQRIDSLVEKWGQIVSPLKWRDEIIELEAYEEEFRREREKLIRKLESEGFKLIDHMAPVYGEQIIDLSDWRNWQAGDIVECLIAPDKHEGYYFSGINYKINAVDLDDEGTDCEIRVYYKKEMSLWCPSSSFKFIRRP